MKTSQMLKLGVRVRFWLAAGMAVAILVAMPYAKADPMTSSWQTAASGAFTNDANWDFFAPVNAIDHARWDTGDHPAYTVAFDQSLTNALAIVGNSAAGSGLEVLWDLDSNTYTLTDGASLTVGNSSVATLRMQNGTVIAQRRFQLGSGTDGQGLLYLSGSNTVFNVTDDGTSAPNVGNSSNATRESLLQIENGATANLVRLRVAGSGGLRGGVIVTGAGSKLTTGHSVGVSVFGGHGRIRVEDGAEWVQTGFSTDIFTGNISHPGQGRLEIDGGTVRLQNMTIGQRGVLDVTLHKDGTSPLITHTPNIANLTLSSGTGGTATLEVSLAPGFEADLGETFTLFQHIDSGLGNSNWTLDGQFMHASGLLENGSTFTVDDYEFQVGITVGAGGSYTLTVIPEPGALALLGMAGMALIAVRRRFY